MMLVQKFLREHGIEELQKQFAIVVTDYPDRISLNYNQIDSPRFNTIVDECRGLILRKGTWDVMAMSFLRFYNFSEGIEEKDKLSGFQREASIGESKMMWKLCLDKALIQNKLDGSLLSCYFDGDKWCVSTRKMAFAEGQTNLGRTFSEVFWDAASKTELKEFLSNVEMREFTFVFELTGPENRVVSIYPENKITLIGARNNLECNNYRELTNTELNNIAGVMKVDRPENFVCEDFSQLFKLVESFPTLQEGVVLVVENENGSHQRVKCKNPQFVAVAHLRENGGVSPKNVLNLVMANEHHEYLKYFECDKPYFDFVEGIYAEIKNRIDTIYKENMGIKEQKEFALTIMPKTVYSFEKGVIFSLRKSGGTVDNQLKDVGAKKIALGINLKQKFIDKFHVAVEEEES